MTDPDRMTRGAHAARGVRAWTLTFRSCLLVIAVAVSATASFAQSVRVAPPRTLPVVPELLGEPMRTQHPIPPIPPEALAALRDAQHRREEGLLSRAQETLAPLLAQLPHHPMVLVEQARQQIARQDWNGLERMAQAERKAQQDSLLLSRELVIALERQGRARPAADVAMEAWAARASEADWAYSTVARLAPADSRGVRESLRRMAERLPERVDVQRGLARLEWKMGDERAAMKVLLASDRPGLTPPLRWSFAEELLRTAAARDSLGAIQSLLSMAGDQRFDFSYRVMAGRRAWDLHRARGTTLTGGPAVYEALRDLPPARWNADLLVGVARSLREAGMTEQARALLKADGLKGPQQAQVALERALTELREGPPQRALADLSQLAGQSPEGKFRYAEALFYSGMADSAKTVYQDVTSKADSPYTGAAFERIYLIEDADPKSALAAFGQLAYREWRGDDKAAMALAESLYRALPKGALWSQAALSLSAKREAGGDAAGALEPLLAVAEQRPEDRLASLARQRAGDIYLFRLKDDAKAEAQYEECLNRYPRAWNAAEVRRRVETIRRRRL